MKKFLSNYKSTIILLAAIIVGAIIGIIFQEKAAVLKPLGDLFLNLLLVIIVPLIFLTITTSITKMKTHIVIHIEKRRKMREIKLYTILSTLSTDEKTESCGIRNVQNKQLFCEVITAIQF